MDKKRDLPAGKAEIVKEYFNEEMTVVWKPKLCIHAAECVKRLPNVYDPKGKPWIKAENATITELKSQIAACPSGALSYYMSNEQKNTTMENQIKINVMENGPLLVNGSIEVCRADGSTESKTTTTAFCRCGASANKPYCDGQHRKINFVG